MSESFSFGLLLLRWIHFVGGVIWIGTLVYLRLIELPRVKSRESLSIPSDLVNRLNILLVVASITGLTAGVGLALILSNLSSNVFTSTGWGYSIFFGSILALIALVATFGGVMPALDKLSSLSMDTRNHSIIARRGELWLDAAILFGIIVLLMMAYAGTVR